MASSYPGQPQPQMVAMQASQPGGQIIVQSQAPMSSAIEWLDPKTYEGITWFPLNPFPILFELFLFGLRWALVLINFCRSEDIQFTVKNGIPAWGNGQFTCGCACGLWLLACVGFAGMQRVYLGDCCCGVVFCLFGGFWGIGQLIDLCMLKSMVERKNAEIKNSVLNRRRELAGPQIVMVSGQPQPQQNMYPAQTYPQQGYYAQPPPSNSSNLSDSKA